MTAVVMQMNLLQPHDKRWRGPWQELLRDFGFAAPATTLVYPAAGFDWRVPVALERLRQRQPNLPMPELGIYIDYSAELLERLKHAHITGDRQFWGPGVQLISVTKISPPEQWVWDLRASGQHAPEGGSVVSDHWYWLQLSLNRREFPILYVPADAVAFTAKVLVPLGIRPDYLATVTDGCRQGGNWCCLSSREGPMYKELAQADLLPKFWLTDHGDISSHYGTLGRVNTGLYGGGHSRLLAVNN